jgi:YNFM family putative membrane transporter
VSHARLLAATVAAYLPASALPAIAGEHDPALLVVPFCLGFAAGFPVWGRAVDRRGATRIVHAALLAAAAAGALVAFAHAAWLLALARLLQGAAAAGVPPAVQAAMAARAGEGRTGRALSGMMLAVAVATLGGPALAPTFRDLGGWTFAAILLGPLPTLACALGDRIRPTDGMDRPQVAEYDDARGVHAGWLVSALVLAGQWTVLTRLAEAVGHAAAPAALTGVAGLPLVLLAARSSDRNGPRATMTRILAIGAAGFAAAATTTTAATFIATAGIGLAFYWAYLPVVAAQVQQAAGIAARGRAAGGLYASMWASAGVAGGLAALAPSWHVVVLGAAVLWATAAVVAARTFRGPAPQSARWPRPQPSPS